MLPKDFPPLSTVQRYFYAWRSSGLLATIIPHLSGGSHSLNSNEAARIAADNIRVALGW